MEEVGEGGVTIGVQDDLIILCPDHHPNQGNVDVQRGVKGVHYVGHIFADPVHLLQVLIMVLVLLVVHHQEELHISGLLVCVPGSLDLGHLGRLGATILPEGRSATASTATQVLLALAILVTVGDTPLGSLEYVLMEVVGLLVEEMGGIVGGRLLDVVVFGAVKNDAIDAVAGGDGGPGVRMSTPDVAIVVAQFHMLRGGVAVD